MDSIQDLGDASPWIVFQTVQGAELRATPLRLGRHQIAFEIYGAGHTLRVSEVLGDFKLYASDRLIYSGRAVVTSLVATSTVVMAEASLDDGWLDPELLALSLQQPAFEAAFSRFLQAWQKSYRILPQYKVVVADMQAFLGDLRSWLDQVELGIRSTPTGDRLQLEQDVAHRLGGATTPVLTELFERFEQAASEIEPELLPAHRAFSRRQLHPLLLCAPFLYRTYHKPLGYAGDYEMVNMIVRDPCEGSSLFAKVVNFWFLQQPPAEAHRNRIAYLRSRLNEAVVRPVVAGGKARILSLGCGPAHEVRDFLKEAKLPGLVQFTLLDFNAETLSYTQNDLETLKQNSPSQTELIFVKKSVNQILKESSRGVEKPAAAQYDLVYCAGLFDYMSDQVCQRLSNMLFDWVAPGGLFIATNVDSSNPRRLTMDFIMEWHLKYRSGGDMANLKPDGASSEDCAVKSDTTGVNIYFEARKPHRG